MSKIFRGWLGLGNIEDSGRLTTFIDSLSFALNTCISVILSYVVLEGGKAAFYKGEVNVHIFGSLCTYTYNVYGGRLTN